MTAIEFVFLTPVLFFMIFATVQFGLYFFADHVAQAAAQAGARKARDDGRRQPGGWSGEATQTPSSDYIHQLGPQLLLDPTDVQATQPDANTVRVEMTAKVPAVFPGLELQGARRPRRARSSGSCRTTGVRTGSRSARRRADRCRTAGSPRTARR